MTLESLFEPHQLGPSLLPNRFVMAPMTRSRADEPGQVPNELMATYYGQRASAGLLITEATQVSLQGQGYARTPGVYTPEQVEGWKKVTREVHARGGRIFVQLWHVGRVGSARVNGLQPVGPSARPAQDTKVYVFDGAPNGDATMIPVDPPRALSVSEITTTVADFRAAARHAIAAGFDGVEIHGANGYLIDQFLRSNSNDRADAYGGDPTKRTRLLLEVAAAVSDEIGADRTGVRLSPFITFKDMDDPEILETMKIAAAALQQIGVTYLHLCEADWDDAPVVPDSFRRELRETFLNTLIATGKMTPNKGAELLASGRIDLIGFGRNFLSNPDYPERVRRGAPLNTITGSHTLFGGGGARGYTDYPTLE